MKYARRLDNRHRAIAAFGVPPGQLAELLDELGVGFADGRGHVALAEVDDRARGRCPPCAEMGGILARVDLSEAVGV